MGANFHSKKRSLTQDSIGPPSTRMPMTLSPVVTLSTSRKDYQRDFPGFEDSRACSIHQKFTFLRFQFGNPVSKSNRTNVLFVGTLINWPLDLRRNGPFE
ncbi:hypothetical protein Tco_0545462 [Tanacetum coccineum]